MPPTDAARLLEIAEACEKASGPSRELSSEIIVAVFGYGRNASLLPDELHVTGSLDAITALIAEQFPGALWAVGHMEHGPFARIFAPNGRGGYDGGPGAEVEAGPEPVATPELALAAAFLRAKARALVSTQEGGSE